MNSKAELSIKFIVSVTATALMVLAAQIFNEPEIIFPEIAALTVGAFISKRMVWNVTPVKMLLLMSASAICGYALSVYVPLPLYIRVVFAFTVCLVTLWAAGSTMLPMISASVLPLLTNVQSIIYPLSVLILTALIICIRCIFEKTGLADNNSAKSEKPELRSELIRMLWLVLIFSAVSALALFTGMTFIIAPPLAVVFAEAAYTDSPVQKAPIKFFIITILCAFYGTGCRFLFTDFLNVSAVIGVSVAVSGALMILLIFKKPFPPAAALAVLPFILPQQAVAFYPFQAAVGAGIFIALDRLYTYFIMHRKREKILNS